MDTKDYVTKKAKELNQTYDKPSLELAISMAYKDGYIDGVLEGKGEVFSCQFKCIVGDEAVPCYEHIGCKNCRFVSAVEERIKKKLTEK
jgi:hypothetical protein